MTGWRAVLLLFLASWVLGSYTPRIIYSPPMAEVPIYKSVEESVYYVEIQVGTPPQVQRLIIDTEIEFSLLIANNSCPSTAYLNCFDFSASETFVSGQNLEHFCLVMSDQAGFVGVPYMTSGRFCLAQYNPSLLGRLTSVDGYFGMGYVSFDNFAFDMWPSLLPPEWPLVYAIQFGGRGRDSLFHFGGYQHAEEIVWSEQQTNLYTADPVFIEAPLFHVSLCDVELSPSESFVIAQFVTSHNCLGLSRSLLLSLRKWLSDMCWQNEENDLQTGHIVCHFTSLDQIHELPVLTFQLANEGTVLRLPLESLVTSRTRVEADAQGNIYEASLCVIQSDHFPSHSKDKVVFGILPMEQFYTVIDVLEARVGLWDYTTPNSTREIGALCPSPPECIGQQQLRPSTNECIDPECRLWEQVDEDTKTCGVSIPLLSFVAVNLLLISLLDFCITETHLRLERKARRSTANTTQ